MRQDFVTEDTSDRKCSLPRDDPNFQPKGWIQGNMRIGPVLEVATSFQHFGIEIRIESVNKDSSHSWVTISHGTFKHVLDSIEEENFRNFGRSTRRANSTNKHECGQKLKKVEWRFPKPHVATGTRPDRALAWWQQMASTLVHEHYREIFLWPSLNPTEQAQVLFFKVVRSFPCH